MLLSEILAEIAEKYPHSLTNASVIRKLNDVQNTLYRTEIKRITQDAYNLTAGTFLYTLPFPFSSLVNVIVDGQQYDYQATDAQSYGTPFYYFNGSKTLGLYPTPTKTITGGIVLTHYIYPTQMLESALTVAPDLDSDFHMLLAYGALVQIAENYADVAMVNNFAARYNGILEDFRRINDETPDYPVIKNVMGVIW